MGYFTNVEQIHPSIWIRPTKDFTERPPIREAGQVTCMGWISLGNPLLPITITESFEKVKPLDPTIGGDSRNMSLYMFRDFWRESQGRALNISRILGIDSEVAIIKVNPNSGFNTDTKVKIYTDGTFESWKNTDPTEPLEILLKFCPSEPIWISVESIDDRIYIEVRSQWGETIYKVNGYADPKHVDEDGYSDFIGRVANCNYIHIKSNIAHTDYSSNYSFDDTLEPLCENIGDEIHTFFHSRNIRKTMQRSDYAATMGIENPTLVQLLDEVRKEFSTPLIVDIITDDIGVAITKKTNLAITDENTFWIWSRTKYDFLLGEENIGLSGDFVGKTVFKNIAGKLRRAENRVSGVAFSRYPISRNIRCGLEPLSSIDKDKLTKNRINTIDTDSNGNLIYTDVLSGSVKTSDLSLFPSADGLNYIKKEIGFLMEFGLGRNVTVAKSDLETQLRLLFEDCWANNFFDSDVVTPYEWNVFDVDGDVVVAFGAYMEKVMRRGEVRSSIYRKVTE